jgi:hypothetical protein
MGGHVLAMQATDDYHAGERHLAGVGMARIEADITRLPSHHGFSLALASATPVEPDGRGGLFVGGAEVVPLVVALVTSAHPRAEWWATTDSFAAKNRDGTTTWTPAFIATVDRAVVAIAAPRAVV